MTRPPRPPAWLLAAVLACVPRATSKREGASRGELARGVAPSGVTPDQLGDALSVLHQEGAIAYLNAAWVQL